MRILYGSHGELAWCEVRMASRADWGQLRPVGEICCGPPPECWCCVPQQTLQTSYSLFGCSLPWFQYIDAELPPESPYLYGLHPNAEIGFLTQISEKLFRTVLEMQPRDHQVGDGAGITREEKVRGGYCLR